jgi:hypothetical protein
METPEAAGVLSVLPDSKSLYCRALGEAFALLSPTLRDFHSRSEGRAQGVLRVRRGEGWLRNQVADLLRLPPAGDSVPIRLKVEPCARGERWVRHFGEQRLETRQWLRRELFLEAAGPVQFGFRLVVEEGGLYFHFARAWLWGIPLPATLSPRVTARATGSERGWIVHVRVEAAGLGMLAEYEGEVTPA